MSANGNTLGDAIKAAIDAVVTKTDRQALMRALAGAVAPDPVWTAMTLANSWTNIGGSGAYNAAYYKDPFGWVHLRGGVTGGTVGSIISTLPAGYRVTNQMNWAPACGATATGFLISLLQTSGGLQPNSACGNSFIYLDTISYYADA